MTASKESRRNEILDVLFYERYLKVADLSRLFGVSQMCIRRDLYQLEEQVLLRRAHGSLAVTPLLRLGIQISPEVIAQLKEDRSEKEAIARTAAKLVQPGEALIFDSGILSYLTVCALSGDLLTQGKLTVITNSLLIALEVAPWPGIETILLGGEYQADGMMNLSGRSTLRSLEGLHADKMFLTAEMVNIPRGLAISRDEIELVEKMIAACTSLIVLTTGKENGQADQRQFLPIINVHTLVIGQGASKEVLSFFQSQGVDTILAQPRLENNLCLQEPT